jgi:hypothetical protein
LLQRRIAGTVPRNAKKSCDWSRQPDRGWVQCHKAFIRMASMPIMAATPNPYATERAI